MTSDNGTERELYVLIDPHCVRHASLDAAVLLAERLRARILAQLMGNELLRQVAQLPFTTEILVSSGEERNLASESLDDLQQQKAYLVERLLAQRAQPRKISFRMEKTADNTSIQVVLEKRRDLFLPAVGKGRVVAKGRSPLASVHWVYDNCEASERCVGLLRDLAASGLTQRIHLYGNKAIPHHILSVLSDAGARVFWANGSGEDAVVRALQTAADADLVILPGTFTSRIGEQRLRELNQRCVAPILVVQSPL